MQRLLLGLIWAVILATLGASAPAFAQGAYTPEVAEKIRQNAAQVFQHPEQFGPITYHNAGTRDGRESAPVYHRPDTGRDGMVRRVIHTDGAGGYHPPRGTDDRPAATPPAPPPGAGVPPSSQHGDWSRDRGHDPRTPRGTGAPTVTQQNAVTSTTTVGVQNTIGPVTAQGGSVSGVSSTAYGGSTGPVSQTMDNSGSVGGSADANGNTLIYSQRSAQIPVASAIAPPVYGNGPCTGEGISAAAQTSIIGVSFGGSSDNDVCNVGLVANIQRSNEALGRLALQVLCNKSRTVREAAEEANVPCPGKQPKFGNTAEYRMVDGVLILTTPITLPQAVPGTSQPPAPMPMAAPTPPAFVPSVPDYCRGNLSRTEIQQHPECPADALGTA